MFYVLLFFQLLLATSARACVRAYADACVRVNWYQRSLPSGPRMGWPPLASTFGFDGSGSKLTAGGGNAAHSHPSADSARPKPGRTSLSAWSAGDARGVAVRNLHSRPCSRRYLDPSYSCPLKQTDFRTPLLRIIRTPYAMLRIGRTPTSPSPGPIRSSQRPVSCPTVPSRRCWCTSADRGETAEGAAMTGFASGLHQRLLRNEPIVAAERALSAACRAAIRLGRRRCSAKGRPRCCTGSSLAASVGLSSRPIRCRGCTAHRVSLA